MQKSDLWIRQQALNPDLKHVNRDGSPLLDDNGHQITGIIYPFVEKQKGQGVVSFGLDSYGYDFRVRPQYKVLDTRAKHLDPHDPNLDSYWMNQESTVIVVPANGGRVVVESVERFNIPRNIQCRTVGKSTYTARLGLQVLITDVEPEYQGTLTFTLLNSTSVPIWVHADQGIASIKFTEGEPCESSYADKGGRYQGSAGIQTAKIKESKD